MLSSVGLTGFAWFAVAVTPGFMTAIRRMSRFVATMITGMMTGARTATMITGMMTGAGTATMITGTVMTRGRRPVPVSCSLPVAPVAV